MTYERLAWDDPDTTAAMHADCTACHGALRLPRPRVDLDAARRPAPSLEWSEQEQRRLARGRKAGIDVSEAAAHLASRLHLHD